MCLVCNCDWSLEKGEIIENYWSIWIQGKGFLATFWKVGAVWIIESKAVNVEEPQVQKI